MDCELHTSILLAIFRRKNRLFPVCTIQFRSTALLSPASIFIYLVYPKLPPLIFTRPRALETSSRCPENLKCEVLEIRLLALFRAARRIT